MAKSKSVGGTYKIDPKTGKLVQVSAGIPKVASKRRGPGLPAGTKCIKPQCGKGPCGS
jgi:hypothetical protein